MTHTPTTERRDDNASHTDAALEAYASLGTGIRDVCKPTHYAYHDAADALHVRAAARYGLAVRPLHTHAPILRVRVSRTVYTELWALEMDTLDAAETRAGRIALARAIETADVRADGSAWLALCPAAVRYFPSAAENVAYIWLDNARKGAHAVASSVRRSARSAAHVYIALTTRRVDVPRVGTVYARANLPEYVYTTRDGRAPTFEHDGGAGLWGEGAQDFATTHGALHAGVAYACEYSAEWTPGALLYLMSRDDAYLACHSESGRWTAYVPGSGYYLVPSIVARMVAREALTRRGVSDDGTRTIHAHKAK